MTQTLERGGAAGSLIGILFCGGIGGFVAWWTVDALEMQGVIGAILAAAIGMLVATGLWIGRTWILRATGILQ